MQSYFSFLFCTAAQPFASRDINAVGAGCEAHFWERTVSCCRKTCSSCRRSLYSMDYDLRSSVLLNSDLCGYGRPRSVLDRKKVCCRRKDDTIMPIAIPFILQGNNVLHQSGLAFSPFGSCIYLHSTMLSHLVVRAKLQKKNKMVLMASVVSIIATMSQNVLVTLARRSIRNLSQSRGILVQETLLRHTSTSHC